MGQRPLELSLERYQACLNGGPRSPKPSTWARTTRPYAPKVLVSATLSQNGGKWRHHLRSWVRATVSYLCQLAGKCNYLQFTAAFRLAIKYRLLLGKLIKIVINSLYCYTRKLRRSACTVFNQKLVPWQICNKIMPFDTNIHWIWTFSPKWYNITQRHIAMGTFYYGSMSFWDVIILFLELVNPFLGNLGE